MKVHCSTNADEAYNKFLKLTLKEMRRTLRSGLSKALMTIVRGARKNLKSAFKHTNQINPKYNDTLQQGIRKTKIKEDYKGVISGKVRAHSNNKRGSGSYRLPMLENGTQPRYVHKRNGKPLKKPAFRGQIKGGHFFKDSVDSNGLTFKDTLIKEVNKAIDKIKVK